MMSLAPVSVHQGRHYYKKDNYYTPERDVENSAWFGRGAAELGLEGRVSAEAFDRLLTGMDPAGNAALDGCGRPARANRRAGIDLTFSAPKSVSIAAFIGGDQRLEGAHAAAVRFALGVAEERYAITRVGGEQNRHIEATGNFIVAQFQHDTSRAQDPQLHTHNVVINAVRREDGKWRSLLNDELYANSKLLGLIYQNDLARRVQELGYGIRVQANGTFELAGYTAEQLKAFSKRRRQIVALGGESQRAARELVMVDRPVKGKELAREELIRRWRGEAQALGLKGPKIQAGPTPPLDHRAVLKAALRHASERDVSFRREAFERFALEANLGALDFKALGQEIRAAQNVGVIIPHAPGRYVTQESLDVELGLIGALARGRSHFAPIVREIPEAIRSNTLGLTAGQKAALEMSLTSPDQFQAWQGVAGAGKTFAMKQLRQVAEAEGLRVYGFAPSASAAKVLASEGQIAADTVASLLTTPREHRGRELWIVDEAGLLPSKDAGRVAALAQEHAARVIFVGDTRQLSGVEAGNPFKLMQQHGIATAHLTESRRQKTPVLKAAAQELAQGEIRQGLSLLDDRIFEYRREATRVRHVASDFLALSPAERAKTIVLAGTNRERELLTEAIRTGLKEQGQLSSGRLVRTLHAKDLTHEERLAGVKITPGDVLVFHKAYRRLGIEKGAQLEVVHVEPQVKALRVRLPSGAEIGISPTRAAGFQVYEVRERELAAGDLVRWTRNDKALGLRNGQDLTVAGVDQRVVLSTRDGRRLELGAGRHHLDHAYVSTVYASQGKTAERVIISADKTFGREAMYVAVTRAKGEVTLYTEDKGRMMQRAEVSRAKESAVSVVAEVASQGLRGIARASRSIGR